MQKMKNVIYTVVTGGYDKLLQPKVIDNDFDYICFSNDIKGNRVGVWEIRKIPFVIEDDQRLSRYPKMHPHKLLTEYQYSLYIDANVTILKADFYRIIKEKIANKIILSGMHHLEVDCAYEEGLRVMISGREKNYKSVFKLLRFLKRENMPYHYGMFEANVIFRNHHDKKIIAQCELWWKCFLEYAKRDQLSYSYSLWKNQIPFDYLLPKGQNTRNSNLIIAGSHGKESSMLKKKTKKLLFRPTLFALKKYVELTKNFD